MNLLIQSILYCETDVISLWLIKEYETAFNKVNSIKLLFLIYLRLIDSS